MFLQSMLDAINGKQSDIISWLKVCYLQRTNDR